VLRTVSGPRSPPLQGPTLFLGLGAHSVFLTPNLTHAGTLVNSTPPRTFKRLSCPPPLFLLLVTHLTFPSIPPGAVQTNAFPPPFLIFPRLRTWKSFSQCQPTFPRRFPFFFHPPVWTPFVPRANEQLHCPPPFFALGGQALFSAPEHLQNLPPTGFLPTLSYRFLFSGTCPVFSSQVVSSRGTLHCSTSPVPPIHGGFDGLPLGPPAKMGMSFTFRSTVTHFCYPPPLCFLCLSFVQTPTFPGPF